MAINPETQYPGKIAPSTPDYPYGAARNITVPGDGTGTPWESALVNDQFGFQQALLSATGIVPSGTPDKVGASQYLDAVQKTAIARAANTTSDTVILSSNTTEVLDDKTHIYDSESGITYVKPTDIYNSIGTGEKILSLVGSTLTTDGGSYTLLKARGGNEVANVKDFGAMGDGATDDTAAIQSAFDVSATVYFPPGTYNISSPLIMKWEHMKVYGDASRGPGQSGQYGSVRIRPMDPATFQPATIGGQTHKCLLWYQRPTGLWTDQNFMEGGVIKDLYLDCADNTAGIHGIVLNRVAVSQKIENVKISFADIGVYGTKWGWGTSFDNCLITECNVAAIKLRNGYNGVSFTSCFLYGGSTETQRLLSLEQDSYGNTFSGGAIEGGQYGVYLDFAQLAIVGVDFEVISINYIYVTGKYGPDLNFASPISSANTCTFVGVTQDHAVRVRGGMLDVSNCFFFATVTNPGFKWAFYGEDGGDKTHNYATRPCISTSNNHFRNWGEWINLGNVFNRIDNLATQMFHGSQLTIKTQLDGDVETTFNADRPYPTYLDGKTRSMDNFGWVPSTNVGQELKAWSAICLGDNSLSGDVDSYVENNYDVTNGEFNIYANYQGSGLTYGRSEIVANRTNSGTVDNSLKVELNTIGSQFAPVSSGNIRLGNASNLWSEVFAVNGTINVSDDRLKTYLTITEKETLVAKELKGLIRKFKLNDAIKLKGDSARIHFGTSAQAVKSVFEKHGLDPFEYALLCYDEWEEIVNEDGLVTREAGNSYGIRYDELLCFIISAT